MKAPHVAVLAAGLALLVACNSQTSSAKAATQTTTAAVTVASTPAPASTADTAAIASSAASASELASQQAVESSNIAANQASVASAASEQADEAQSSAKSVFAVAQAEADRKAKGVAAAKAAYLKQMKAAKLTPDYDGATAGCDILDISGLITPDYFYTDLITDSPAQIKGLQIQIATLCPRFTTVLNAALDQIHAEDAAASSAAAEQEAAGQVTYKISGDASSALITWSDDGTNIEQASGAGVPWSKTLTIPASDYRFLSVSAQNDGGGSITCSILVAGKVVDTHTSTGDYAIAMCSAS